MVARRCDGIRCRTYCERRRFGETKFALEKMQQEIADCICEVDLGLNKFIAFAQSTGEYQWWLLVEMCMLYIDKLNVCDHVNLNFED